MFTYGQQHITRWIIHLFVILWQNEHIVYLCVSGCGGCMYLVSLMRMLFNLGRCVDLSVCVYALMSSAFQWFSFSYHSSHMACASGAWKFSGHEGISSHLRPPVTKHTHNTDSRGKGEMSSGQPILELIYTAFLAATIIASIFSLLCLLPLYPPSGSLIHVLTLSVICTWSYPCSIWTQMPKAEINKHGYKAMTWIVDFEHLIHILPRIFYEKIFSF